MSVFQDFIAHLRCCPCCHSNFGRTEWLCSNCYEEFLKRVNRPEGQILLPGGISVFYLAGWEPEDPFMTKLVHSLKGGGLVKTYRDLASLFLLKHSFWSKKGLLIYPSKGQKDHAFEWSQSLSRVLNIRALPLELQSSKKQALLSRGERREVEFKTLKVPNNSPLIFADDIVTTGATAHSAWRALGQPKSFAIWSLFYRRSL